MKEITEDYVSFEVAKLLKEKGFDEKCFQYWHEVHNELIHSQSIYPIQNITNPCFFGPAAPTQSIAMKWLREVKKMAIEVNINFDIDGDNRWYYEYGFCIFQLSGTFEKLAECDYDGYKTYEEACEAAIKYSLENLI